MSYVIAAIVGALIGYFGGDYMGIYDGYAQYAHFVGAAVVAVVFLGLALALRPRRGAIYNGPALD